MSEIEHRPLDRGAGPLLRGWRLGEREGEGGKWVAINPRTLPLAARLVVLSTISPNALDIPAATGALTVAPNPLAALFDGVDALATWPSSDIPIGVPFGAPVQRSSPRRAQSTSQAQPKSPLSESPRSADLRLEMTPDRSDESPRASGPADRSPAAPTPSAQPFATLAESPAPSPDGRSSAAEAAQRLLAAGGKPTLAVTNLREPPPQMVGENSGGLGPLTESSRGEAASPLDNWPADPATPKPFWWVESATEPPSEAGLAAQPAISARPQQRRTAAASPTTAVNEAERGASPLSYRSLSALAPNDSGALAAESAVPNPPSQLNDVSGVSPVSGGVAAWPGDPVAGDAGPVAGAGFGDAAEVRRANIARVLEAGGGRPTVVVSGVSGPGPVVSPSPLAPVAVPGSAPSPASGLGVSPVSGGVAAWPGDPVAGDAGPVAGAGFGDAAEVRRANIARVLEAGGGRPTVVVSGVSGPGPVVSPSPLAPVAVPGSAPSPASGLGVSPVSGGVAAWPGDLILDKGPVAWGRDKQSTQPTGERAPVQAAQFEGDFPSKITQSVSVRRAGEATPRLLEQRSAAERSRISQADMARVTELPNGQPTGSVRDEPTATLFGLSPQGRAESASVADPQVRRISEQGLRLGLGAATEIRSSQLARTAEPITPASWPSATFGQFAPSSASATPSARPTVAESVASRSLRREQPGVLGRQASAVDRSGGAGSLLGSPAVDRGLGAVSVPSAVSPDSGTVSAENLVARLQRRAPQPQPGRAQRERPQSPASTPQRGAPPNQRSVSVPPVLGNGVTGLSVSSASSNAAKKSETIRRSPTESGSGTDAADEPSNDLDIDALTDEIERRLQRRLKLGFDRRGGFRGGGRSWPR